MNRKIKLIGPFRQLLTMDHLSFHGPLRDHQTEIIAEAGIFISNGRIIQTGPFEKLRKETGKSVLTEECEEDLTALPEFIDAHTHICFSGSRAKDYAKRLDGKLQPLAVAYGTR